VDSRLNLIHGNPENSRWLNNNEDREARLTKLLGLPLKRKETHDTNNMTAATIQQAIKSYQKAPPPAIGDGEWVVDVKYSETRGILAKSFAGTEVTAGEPVSDWVCSHIVGSWYTEEEHLRTVRFALGVGCYDVFKRHPLVVARRETTDGELSSAAIVSSYNPKREASFSRKVTETWRESMAVFKLLLHETLPELLARREHRAHARHFDKKWKALISTMTTFHKKYGPREDHWYINMVGVGPEHKGKGYGRELMEKIHSLADEAGVPCCYLECGASNKAFYERVGYTAATQVIVDDPVDSTREPCVIFVMVRMHPVLTAKSTTYHPIAHPVGSTLLEEERKVSPAGLKL
jgi:ribosomal protein S18 acetylase RimI-like enzyme